MKDPARVRSLFPLVFLLSAAAALVPLWSVKYPPMVDLPQHAGQVFVWTHYSDPAFGYSEVFEIGLLSPYLVGHALGRLFATVMPVPAAMKTMVSLAILALPLATAWLLKRTGSDVWGALLGFPLAYGFTFYWGFTNYMLAVPVGLAFLALGLGYARDPSRRNALALALFAFVLYYCHALVFAISVPVAGLWILLVGRPGWKTALIRIWPLVPAAAVITLWVLLERWTNPHAAPPTLWSEPPWQRLQDLPAMLLGAGREDGPRLAGGLLAVLLPFVGSRPRGPLWRLVPAAAALSLFLAAPNRALGTWYVYPRYAVFAALFALLAFEPAAAPWRRRLGALLTVGFVVGWMAFLTVDFRPMDAEGRRFDDLLEHMESGRRVLGLNFDPGFEVVAGMPVFGHFHMWYQAEKGGIAEFTFATSPPNLVYYRQAAGPLAPPDLSLYPGRFDFRRHGHFDYFVVRAKQDLGPRLFRAAPVALEARSGNWWLYRRIAREPG